MFEFVGSRNSQENVSEVLPVSNAIEIVVGTAETLLTNPDPSNWRRLILHNEVAAHSFRARLGDYIERSFVDDKVSLGDDEVTITAHGYVSGDGSYQLTLGQAILAGSPGIVLGTTPSDTFTRDAGSWRDEGFVPNQIVTLGGSASNDGAFTVSSSEIDVTDSILTVDENILPEASQTDLTVTAAGEALPTGLAALTDYYIERVDDNTIVFHTTQAGALLGSTDSPGTVVDITAVTQGGVHRIGGVLLATPEPPTSSQAASHASFQLTGRTVLSAPTSITVAGSNSAAVLTVWWTP